MTPRRLFEIAERMAQVIDELENFAKAERPGEVKAGVSWIRDRFEEIFQILLNARWNSPRHPLHAEIKAAVKEAMARGEVRTAIAELESSAVALGAALQVADIKASTGACRAATTRRKTVKARRLS